MNGVKTSWSTLGPRWSVRGHVMISSNLAYNQLIKSMFTHNDKTVDRNTLELLVRLPVEVHGLFCESAGDHTACTIDHAHVWLTVAFRGTAGTSTFLRNLMIFSII